MHDDPNRFHRRSMRLKGYDYTQAGAYFVTIITLGRELLFGEIINGEMRTNDLGQVVRECWQGIPKHFPNVEVEPFVVMPNHIHGIITILNDRCRGTIFCRGTIYRAPTTTEEKFGKPVIGSVPTIVRTFKAAVTRRVGHQLGIANVWQRNYYEHIIRDQSDLEDISKYILANPGNSADDPEYIL